MRARCVKGFTAARGHSPCQALSSKWARPRRAASGSPRGRRASRRAPAGCCPGRGMPCPAAREAWRAYGYRACKRWERVHAARVGERHQPESRLVAGYLLAPLRPARHDRVLGAGCLLLITPRVAQKGGHLPHRRRLRFGGQFSGAGARPKTRACQVRGDQPASGQATEELFGAFEHGVGIAAADERRDRRSLFRLGAAPAQAPQAAVDAATVAGRGEGGTQDKGGAQGRSCPVINEVVSLDVVRDAVPSPEHAQTQAVEAGHGPQPPQGGAGLHGTIAAAAQRGGERGGDNKVQRSKREAMCIRPDSGECCNDDERPEPRPRDDASGAQHADRA
eukprot:scaffold35471_cov87-Phaeocystis_antarctica.AAC.1